MKRVFRVAVVMVAYVLTLYAVVGLVGCTYNSAPNPSSLKSGNLTYFKDARTGICYAGMNSLDVHSGWKTTTITYVPCTPEVEKMIK